MLRGPLLLWCAAYLATINLAVMAPPPRAPGVHHPSASNVADCRRGVAGCLTPKVRDHWQGRCGRCLPGSGEMSDLVCFSCQPSHLGVPSICTKPCIWMHMDGVGPNHTSNSIRSSLGLHCFLRLSCAGLTVVLGPGCCWACSAFSV